MLWQNRAAHSLLSCFILFLVGASPQLAQSQGWVETDRTGRVAKDQLQSTFSVIPRALNLRGDPSIQNPPIGVLNEGEAVLELERTFNTSENRAWSRVQIGPELDGWAATNYLEPVTGHLAAVEQALLMLSGLSSNPAPAEASTTPAVDRIHAGFVYSAPIGDAGWTYSHDQGRKAIEQLPFVSETSYIESVPEDPERVSQAIDDLVAGGANLIFTTSFGFMDPTIEAAKRYPDVTFMHCAGFKTAENAGTYFGRIYEARYLAGMVAGGTTASGIIGYVAAFPIAQVLRGINAFTLGARAVNPDAEVRVLWTGTWYGPGIEKEAADRLIDFGADVLTMHQNSPATIQAAEQRGKFGIGYHSDMSLFAPTASLTAAAWNWEPVYTKIATDLHKGEWRPDQHWWGIERGAVNLAPLNKDLPDGLQERVRQANDDIAQGRLRVFEGTIRDSEGIVRVPSGRILSDADLLSMDYLVLGVKGDIPQPRSKTGQDN